MSPEMVLLVHRQRMRELEREHAIRLLQAERGPQVRRAEPVVAAGGLVALTTSWAAVRRALARADRPALARVTCCPAV
ncbi:hypothetical protein [Cellulomonas soli]|uniref:Uncharacterized protein n=1 Tax=Cellulomonas soli TaxID=931535 RepID=A0A512PG78_9CELL|nr:hypothetical protein [Cellulomonas soli]NYI58082.1 hypothetical protein [Cellulomonas soli]GEP70217.1 hypothetical protein CSO01_29320 [Cellulomonas soli]